MSYIGSVCFLMNIKKCVIRSLVYLLSGLLCTNVNAATSSTCFFHGQQANNPVVAENMLKVDIYYYRDFPYRPRYAHQKIKDCIKIPARGIVRCKEFISLVRPENQVNSWLSNQDKKGYLPLTMKSFGVANTVGRINKVTPADFLPANKKMDNLKSPYVPATGLFIRHVLDVREYTFKNIKTNVVFSVKATPEHPVYSASRLGFVPISKLSPEDHLLSDNGEKIQLLCPYSINQGVNQGIKKGCGAPFNQGNITRVYNIETSWRHTYFVQGERLLVHNCNDVPGNTKQGSRYHRNQIRLIGRHEKNIEYSEPRTLDSIKNRKSGGIRKSLRLGFVNEDNKTVEIAGVVDSEGNIGRFSELDDLYIRNGRLRKGWFFSTPVNEKVKDFDFDEEFNCQRASQREYNNELNKSYAPISSRFGGDDGSCGGFVLAMVILGIVVIAGGGAIGGGGVASAEDVAKDKDTEKNRGPYY